MTLQLNLDIHNELLVVNFAGGGGSCTGIEMALGRRVDIALSPTFAPALDKAAGILRRKNPQQDDGELLEQILLAGICQIIDNNPSVEAI